MVEFTAFHRSVRFLALALCAAVIAAIATPASAKPKHGRHAHAAHGHHHAKQHHATSHHARRHHMQRHAARHRGRHRASVAPQLFGFGNAGAVTQQQPQQQQQLQSSSGFGASAVVAEARRYIGGNPTGRSRLWCARFMNMVLKRSGHQGTGSDMARSFAHYGQRVSGPQVGAIAVMSRGKRGGHVGIVSGIDPHGNPIVVSGNHGHRVAESVYPRGRIYAYVMPEG
ncbi:MULTISPECIES: TIGR02594 family protein [Rhodopseudomonas]|uniref:Amidase n=1 Tax=Rhodopseudomonas palustris TaxID=1076 RepID=A0A0D7E245_RHOPL|nr:MULTISPECIES: TIGR02594 family protein [Rhodopseudomonas]KIZ34591.1 amidase [Rhodopseudomonas palustris]MDF3811061.1 TIGR02594 family protein [Rhodopseudomonas sp. BAL398]WOK15622.1 TIGR02594 family protein [Rhodopseudomonas sp. BAL398]